MRSLAVLALVAALSSCAGDDAAADDTGPTDEADADTDADSDTDVDTDADSDTDTGAPIGTTPPDLAGCEHVVELDEGENGSIEATTVERHDADGLVVRREVTSGGVTSVVEWDYEDGFIVEQRTDATGDGTFEQVITVVRDAAGEPLSLCLQSDGDPQCELTETYTLGANGKVSLYESDVDGDGATDITCTYTYDAMDRLTVQDCTGLVVQRTTNTWTGGTEWDVIVEVDVGTDGAVEQTTVSEHDALGQLVRFERDAYAPVGEFETVLDYAWRPDGQVESVIGVDVVVSGPQVLGPYGYGETFTYDAEGYRASRRYGYDLTGDPQPDVVFLETDTWDCP